MPEICAVLSDIDGTILRHGTAAPTPAVQEAIKLLTVPLIPVSIRSYQLLRRQAWAFGATVCIPDGGATIAFAETGEIIWRQWLTAEAVEGIVHRIGRRCVMMSCQEKYRPFTPDETALLSYRSTGDSPAVFAVYQNDQKHSIREALDDMQGISYRFMGYKDEPGHGCLQVTQSGVSKEGAARELMRLAQLEGRTVLAIGDDYEGDSPLFRAVGEHGIKVAMEDAQADLIQLADYVAPPAAQDGFATAMSYYGLI